jgi:hypothetical protein
MSKGSTMNNKLTDILGEALAPEIVAELQEAFDAKVASHRHELEESVRAELGKEYEHDKSNLVEAMDKMISDALVEQAKTFEAERLELRESKARYEKGLLEARQNMKANLKEHMDATNSLVTQALKPQVKALHEAKKNAKLEATRLGENVNVTKRNLAERHVRHVKAIDKFVTETLTRELSEFSEERRAVTESRIKLHREAKQKLDEAQQTFVKRSAHAVDKLITETLQAELAQLKEDLEIARQNSFGRKIFETFAAEFMGSYYSDGTEAGKWRKIAESHKSEIAARDSEIASTKKKLDEAAAEINNSKRAVRLAEDRIERNKIMSELVSNLRGETKTLMESMLESTKTSALRASFEKLLPAVLSENGKSTSRPTNGRAVLSEQQKPTRAATTITGDRKVRLVEASETPTSAEELEINNLVRLSGFNN